MLNSNFVNNIILNSVKDVTPHKYTVKYRCYFLEYYQYKVIEEQTVWKITLILLLKM